MSLRCVRELLKSSGDNPFSALVPPKTKSPETVRELIAFRYIGIRSSSVFSSEVSTAKLPAGLKNVY